MSEFKGTTGPWAVGNMVEPCGRQHLAIGDASSRTICSVSPMRTVDESDLHNAHLIAAAPDLLSVCEEFAICCDQAQIQAQDQGRDPWPESDRMLRLRAAISKALGQPQ